MSGEAVKSTVSKRGSKGHSFSMAGNPVGVMAVFLRAKPLRLVRRWGYWEWRDWEKWEKS